MLEIEVKYRVDDFGPVEARLRDWGAAQSEERDDADTYFNAPHRDFAQTDEALRVRRIGERSFVTYKGPKIDRTTKTRTEIEVPLAEGSTNAADFEQSGRCGSSLAAAEFHLARETLTGNQQERYGVAQLQSVIVNSRSIAEFRQCLPMPWMRNALTALDNR